MPQPDAPVEEVMLPPDFSSATAEEQTYGKNMFLIAADTAKLNHAKTQAHYKNYFSKVNIFNKMLSDFGLSVETIQKIEKQLPSKMLGYEDDLQALIQSKSTKVTDIGNNQSIITEADIQKEIAS
jgi:hypothetical protein